MPFRNGRHDEIIRKEGRSCGKLGLQVEEFLPLAQKKMTSEDISIGTLYLVVEI